MKSVAAAAVPCNDALFPDIAGKVGLDFQHFNGATGRRFMPEIMGAGAALFDYDNDGDLDIYLVQGKYLDRPGFPAGRKPGNRLFKNLLAETGELRFVDVTEKAGVGHVGFGMGVAAGDYDNDGLIDLYVTNFGENVLYHNNGDGTFTDVTRAAGVADSNWSTSAAWFDFDGDGLLDLFVCNYVDFTVAGNRECRSPAGELDYCTPKMYRPVPSRLFRNLGNGRFEDVTEAAGVDRFYGPALGVVCADFNGDGRTDIFVANDTAANHLWLNLGNGTFREAALDSGVAYSGDGLAKAGMGVTLADVENNGGQVLLVTNLAGEGASVFRADREGQFEEVTAQYGLFQPTFGRTGFGTGWFDCDNDGRLDLLIANGGVTLTSFGVRGPSPYAQSNQLFHNEGPGTPFRDISDCGGESFRLAAVSRAAAFGDIDNDGAIDIVVTSNNGPVRLLHNRAAARRHWLIVKLEVTGKNRFALGARVGLVRRGHDTLWRRAHTDSSYLSSNDPRVHFGLGDHPNIDAVIVHWPDNSKEEFRGLRSDRIAAVRQGSGTRLNA
jgi:hypothetical protein